MVIIIDAYFIVVQNVSVVKGVEKKLEGSQLQLASSVSSLKQQLLALQHSVSALTPATTTAVPADTAAVTTSQGRQRRSADSDSQVLADDTGNNNADNRPVNADDHIINTDNDVAHADNDVANADLVISKDDNNNVINADDNLISTDSASDAQMTKNFKLTVDNADKVSAEKSVKKLTSDIFDAQSNSFNINFVDLDGDYASSNDLHNRQVENDKFGLEAGLSQDSDIVPSSLATKNELIEEGIRLAPEIEDLGEVNRDLLSSFYDSNDDDDIIRYKKEENEADHQQGISNYGGDNDILYGKSPISHNPEISEMNGEYS